MTHVACHAARYERGKYVVWLPARLTHEAGGAIVGEASAEVYRSPPYDGAVFAIWDLRHLPVIDDASDPWAIKRSLGIAQH